MGRRWIALGNLEKITPPERKAEVMRVVETKLDDPEVNLLAAQVFCAWATKENVPTLLKMLNLEKVEGPKYTAMKAPLSLIRRQFLLFECRSRHRSHAGILVLA